MVYFVKRVPPAEIAYYVVETSISRDATSLIRSIADSSSSKLRLFIFETSDYAQRRFFPRGWTHGTHLRSNDVLEIPKHLVKYHVPEFETLPAFVRAQTLRDYCENQRYLCEESIIDEEYRSEEEEI